MRFAAYVMQKRLLIAALVLCIIITLIVCLSALSRTVFGDTQKLTVVIDAGHGGIDGGVSGKTTGVNESDINLAISLVLKEYFEDAGINVVLTRKTGAGLYGLAVKGYKKRDMQKRKEIIEAAKPVAMISIHQNQYSLSSRRGGQTFYRKDSESGRQLADNVQKQLNLLYADVKDYSSLTGDYYMLNCTDFPSVIVECGFLSNKTDEGLLVTGDFQQKVAYSIFKGVIDYFSYAITTDER